MRELYSWASWFFTSPAWVPFFTGVSPVALWVALGLYVARAFGVTAGFHRLLAHGAYKASRPVQFLLALLGSLAVQGGAALVGQSSSQSPPLYRNPQGHPLPVSERFLVRTHGLDDG